MPGRFTVKFSTVKDSPFTIFLAATILFLTIGLFLASEVETSLMPEPPTAFSILRMAITIVFSSSGSSEAL